jgi:putative SOS response-associated peptidase YedK
MCGRIVLKAPPEQVAREFALTEVPDLVPRYNIAPTEPVAAIRATAAAPRASDPATGPRRCDRLQWGLIPPWSRDPREGARMFNARSETVAQKPAFREAFAHRRCLVPVDGFYEWQKRGGQRRPFYFHDPSGRLLALAGLWERWEYPGGRVIESCSVLTTAANAHMRRIHHRMPVLLPPQAQEPWLTTPADRAAGLQDLLRPAPEDALQSWPVSSRVNRSDAEGEDLVAPLHDDPPAQLDLF